MSCARLHNFIITMDVPDDEMNDEIPDRIVSMPNAPNGMAYLPVMPDPNDQFEKVDGVSQTRISILETIAHEGIRRPRYNLIRNEIDNHEVEYFNPM